MRPPLSPRELDIYFPKIRDWWDHSVGSRGETEAREGNTRELQRPAPDLV